MSQSSQKFIARNRAPRVQIEYDVETYGSDKKVRLPFVMAVLADLAGQSSRRIDDVAERRLADIDVDNFDQRMKALAPRVAFTVPNTLAGQGRLAVDLSFEGIEDFSPAAIAAKVDPLRRLLQARVQLANLQTYMDGKSGAEDLVRRLLGDPQTLRALAAPERAAQAHANGSGAGSGDGCQDGVSNSGPNGDPDRGPDADAATHDPVGEPR